MRREGAPGPRHLRTAAPRRLRSLVAAAAVVLLAGGGVIAAAADGDDRPDPEVLGVATEREPTPEPTVTTTATTATTTTTAPPTTTTAPPPTTARAPVAAAPVVTASPPTTSPPTTSPPPPTTVTCRNSGDPACGPLSWTPSPTDAAPVVRAEPAPTTVEAGRSQGFAVVVDDPDGATSVADCVTWTTSDPSVPAIGSCGPVTGGCPRFGPHDPPPPTPRETRVPHEMTFSTPGDHTVTVSGSTPDRLDDGCHNPYTSPWSHTFSITVLPSPDDGPAEPPAEATVDDGVRLG